MCQILGKLTILDIVPRQKDHESLFNCAIDVRSASMLYLAAHIRHDATWLGGLGRTTPLCMLTIKGKVFKVFFAGEKITDAGGYLKWSVENYTRELNNVHFRTTVEINSGVNETRTGVFETRDDVRTIKGIVLESRDLMRGTINQSPQSSP